MIRQPKTDNQKVINAYSEYLEAVEDLHRLKELVKQRKADVKALKKEYKRVYRAARKLAKVEQGPGRLKSAYQNARMSVYRRFKEKYDRLALKEENPQAAAAEEFIEEMDKLTGLLGKVNKGKQSAVMNELIEAGEILKEKKIGTKKTQQMVDQFLNKMKAEPASC